MFRKEFQQIDIERAMQFSLDVLSELVAMDEAAKTFKAAEVAAIEKAKGLGRTDGSLALPGVSNVRANGKTFAQKADPGAGALLEIVRLFYGCWVASWNENIEQCAETSRCCENLRQKILTIDGSASLPVHVGHGSGNKHARSSSTPARPYMARLRVFSLLICPSAWPLLHGSVMAFFTASRSR